MSQPMKKSDPAYWLLEEGLSGKRKIKKSPVYNEDCYICNDPEFALMGLPLCRACPICGAHIAADDYVCDNGHDEMEYYEKQEEVRENIEAIEDGFDKMRIIEGEICNLEKFGDVSVEEKVGDKILKEIVKEKQDDLDAFLDLLGW